MTFEREKRMNLAAMIAGVIVAVAGLVVYYYGYIAGGVILMVAGVAILMICWSISNFFFRFKMREDFERKKNIK